MMTTDAAAESDICTQCGLCCDGTLFTHGPLELDEVERVRLAGLTVVTVKEEPRFQLPCPQLCGTRCGVYTDRPQRCRDFKCVTLKALAAGQIDVDEAYRRINKARAASENARMEFLPGENFHEARRRYHKSAGEIELARASPMFMLKMGALELVLHKFFRSPEGSLFKHTNDTAPTE